LLSFPRLQERLNCDVWLFPNQDEWTYLGVGRSIGVMHDLMHRYEPQFPEVSAHFKYTRRELHYRKLARYSAGILVDSNIGKRQASESYKIACAKLHVLPFIAPSYIRTAVDVEAVRQRYGLPGRYIFYPAQFWVHKNHIGLVHALAEANRGGEQIHLVFAGAPKNDYTNVHAVTQRLGLSQSIRFLDYVPN